MAMKLFHPLVRRVGRSVAAVERALLLDSPIDFRGGVLTGGIEIAGLP